MATNNHQALTLERGLRVLEALAHSDESLPVTAIAERLGIHRQAVYRLLGTLEQRNLAVEAQPGRWRLGFGAVTLAGAVVPRLQSAVRPMLRDLAEASSATALLGMAEGEQSIALLVVEPSRTGFHISYREGSRAPLTVGAAGIAILATRSARDDDPEDVRVARANGYSVTRGQIIPGALGIACPVVTDASDVPGTSVGVIALAEGADVEGLIQCVRTAAEQVSAALRT